MSTPTFHWADYLVFGLSLASSAVIGFYFGFVGKNQTTSDQLVAGRSLSPIPVSISALASILSATFIIAIPGEIYAYGGMYSTIFFGYMLCVPWTAFGFIPTFYNMNITSAYEYIEKRFNVYVQAVSSVLFAVMQLLYMGISIYAPAVAFSQVTGLSEYVTMLGLGVVCTFYTAVGGMKAVIWTDVLQMAIILVGLIIIVAKGTFDAGGIAKVFEICSEGGRLDFSAISIHPAARHTWWTQTIGGCFSTMTSLTSNQAMIQRYISIKTLKEAKMCPIYMLLSIGVVLGLVACLGWVMYAYFVACDPILSGQVMPDQILPLFMMNVLSGWHGIPGLFTSAVFAATLSTLSSGVNAMAAVILMDMIQPLYKVCKGTSMQEKASSIITKVLAAVIGMLCVGIAYLAPLMGSTLIQLTASLMSMIGGPLLGLFVMAIFMPCINSWGAWCGLWASLILTAWVSMGTIFSKIPRPPLYLNVSGCDSINETYGIYGTTHLMTTSDYFTASTPSVDLHDPNSYWLPVYELSYMWYSALSVLIGIIIAVPISYITGGNKIRERRFYYDYSSLCSVFGLKSCCLFDDPEKEHNDTTAEKDIVLTNGHTANGVGLPNYGYEEDHLPQYETLAYDAKPYETDKPQEVILSTYI